MKVIKVCIGSACHLKGSYDVIEELKRLIKEKNLEDQIELNAAFCLGHCVEAVSVLRWDNKVISFSRDNVAEIFEQEIEAYLKD
ncbi:(2Fe-2S) ferredoxin domain-containing protein [Mycoplasmatota bacterium]|nr:(2Fe-2S) ferredoxin domain-containing protein [Mycoplasmatota bacterium]